MNRSQRETREDCPGELCWLALWVEQGRIAQAISAKKIPRPHIMWSEATCVGWVDGWNKLKSSLEQIG